MVRLIVCQITKLTIHNSFLCRLIMMSALVSIVLMVLALSGPAVAFVPIGGGGSTHVSITGTALLQKVTETCRVVVEASGHKFELTVGRKIRTCIQKKSKNLFSPVFSSSLPLWLLTPHLCPQGTSPEELVQACLGPTATGEVSGAKFHSALQEIYTQNGLVDRDFANRWEEMKRERPVFLTTVK